MRACRRNRRRRARQAGAAGRGRRGGARSRAYCRGAARRTVGAPGSMRVGPRRTRPSRSAPRSLPAYPPFRGGAPGPSPGRIKTNPPGQNKPQAFLQPLGGEELLISGRGLASGFARQRGPTGPSPAWDREGGCEANPLLPPDAPRGLLCACSPPLGEGRAPLAGAFLRPSRRCKKAMALSCVLPTPRAGDAPGELGGSDPSRAQTGTSLPGPARVSLDCPGSMSWQSDSVQSDSDRPGSAAGTTHPFLFPPRTPLPRGFARAQTLGQSGEGGRAPEL